MNISSFLIGYQTGKNAGGGSSADVRYVTFMSYDGTKEHGRIPVAVGYDCPNPKFAVTRESDAQYDYVLAGWATEVNGALNSDALKAITEDRTVYANFASVLRSYTITFCDEDGTVLNSKKWAYGSVPSYTPTKDGYDFVRWNPEPVAVTGEASYTAVWKLKASFTTASWAEIAEICDAGNAATTFKVGDYKPVTLTYADGTKETINFRIVDMDADMKEDGTTAALTLLADNLVKNSVQPANSSSDSKRDIQESSKMSAFMTTLENALPSDLQAVIKPVRKYYDYISYTYRKVFVPTRQNMDGNTESYNNDNYQKYPQKQYAYFADGNTIKRTKLTSTTADEYWVNTASRGSSGSSTYYFHYIFDGAVISASPSDNSSTYGVLFGFCI